MPARLAFSLLVSLAAAFSARAQDAPLPRSAAEVVMWRTAEPMATAPGETARLGLEATIADGWKMYAPDSPPPTRGVRVRTGEMPRGLGARALEQETPREGFDPNFGKDVRYYEASASFALPVDVARDAPLGAREVSGEVEFMVCTDKICLPPTREPVAWTLVVAGETAPQQPEPQQLGSPRSLDLTAGASALAGSADEAQLVGSAQHVRWSLRAAPEPAAPGGVVRLAFAGEVADGWKTYALGSPRPSPGLVLTLDLPDGFSEAGAPRRQSTPTLKFDEGFQVEARTFTGAFAVEALVRAPDSASGAQVLGGSVRYVTCNDATGICLPPATTALSAPVTFAAGAPATPPASALPEVEAPVQAASVDASNARVLGSGSLWAFLLLAVGAGLAALLTPCVFPMIPLTVSYFTKHADNRAEALRMASVYGLAIVGTFTGLGLVMALVVGAAGAQTIAANPWVNLFIGVIFVLFGLSLLGLFELRVPHGLLNYVDARGRSKGGALGVWFMGLTLTLVSFSCTVPFVGALLAATAGGTWLWPIVGMLAFSTTFALPFVGFALFPRALSRLPKSGSWMNVVKVTLGFVELAAALKFLSNADLVWGTGLLPRPLAIALAVVLFFHAGMYLIGKLRLAHEAPSEGVSTGRLLAGVAFFGLALYLLPGLFGAPLGRLDAYLPPRQATDVSLLIPTGQGSVASQDEAWITDDIPAAYAESRTSGKPIFVDFTGYTCTNCREMEANVFPQPAVATRFEDFVLLRLYTDGLERGPEFQRYQLGLVGTVALPTYAVVAPPRGEDGAPEVVAQISGMVPTDDFATFLDAGSSAFAVRGDVASARL